ncbi:hypothetical protein [Streptomyces sp. SPB4]|uniref:hypothetical protein n=1 Tax=Streptomyces sp. SPB4 TaxID=2940553 RepID=UPI0024767347|nr:hypothetical protein [Streptomyces sp. SPB4]MDH6544048.1 hypothetical protein [Streptomyces sp. SPB4]
MRLDAVGLEDVERPEAGREGRGEDGGAAGAGDRPALQRLEAQGIGEIADLLAYFAVALLPAARGPPGAGVCRSADPGQASRMVTHPPGASRPRYPSGSGTMPQQLRRLLPALPRPSDPALSGPAAVAPHAARPKPGPCTRTAGLRRPVLPAVAAGLLGLGVRVLTHHREGNPRP